MSCQLRTPDKARTVHSRECHLTSHRKRFGVLLVAECDRRAPIVSVRFEAAGRAPDRITDWPRSMRFLEPSFSLCHRQVAQIFHLKSLHLLGNNDLNQFCASHPEDRAKCFVALHNLMQTLLQSFFLQRPANAKKKRVVVDRAIGV